VKAVLEAAGVEVNEARVKALVSALEEVNIDEAIEKASFAVAPSPAPAAPVEEEAKEEKKEEEEEEEEKREEEAIEGLGALFG
jgi:large subunit ribosomal protein L12